MPATGKTGLYRHSGCPDERPEPVTLVAIGPLTNIALLLTHYPECAFNIRRLVIMGGSAGRGNFTPNAEFNIAVDPEAASRVFRVG
ncbi:ribonucleoside hydrolase RihC [Citrobacter koseri]|nr:ribonucleoside hydrolase RihC [Citrobacter koseri]